MPFKAATSLTLQSQPSRGWFTRRSMSETSIRSSSAASPCSWRPRPAAASLYTTSLPERTPRMTWPSGLKRPGKRSIPVAAGLSIKKSIWFQSSDQINFRQGFQIQVPRKTKQGLDQGFGPNWTCGGYGIWWHGKEAQRPTRMENHDMNSEEWQFINALVKFSASYLFLKWITIHKSWFMNHTFLMGVMIWITKCDDPSIH